MKRAGANPNSTLARRNFLASAGAVSTGMLMAQEAAGQEDAAANVQDRTTQLKITAIKPYRVASKVFVKIETNLDIFGWGEITGLEPNVARQLTQSLFPMLDGENPTRIEHLWQKLYRAHRDIRGGPFMTHAISAIDMALWDITGKAWGVPVHRLLGGPTRDYIPMYPNKRAYKIGPGGPRPWSGNPAEIEGMVKHVAEIRKRLGPDGSIMVDVHCAFPPPLVIQLGAAIEPHDILFLEEPAVPGNIEVFKRIKEQVRIPLATGERDRTIWGVIPYLQERCIDILQPDVGHTGGISQVKKIATLAEAYHVPLAPHCGSTLLGLTASLHVSAAIPFLLIHEGNPKNNPFDLTRANWKTNSQGDALLPEGVGLGVEVDEKKAAEIDAKPSKYRWPSQSHPDGSIADY